MPVPKGYTLDQPAKLPPGYTLDGPSNPSADAAANPFANAPAHAPADMQATPMLPQGFSPFTPRDNWHNNTKDVPSDGSQTFGSPAYAAAQNFNGRTANAALFPFRHPIDAAEGMAKLAVDPVGTGQQIGEGIGSDFAANGYKAAIPHLLGDAAGTVIGGKLMGGAMKPAAAAIRDVGKIAEYTSATPDAQSMAATRFIVPGSPGEVLNRALKPGVAYGADTSGLFNDSLGPISQQGPIKNVADFGKASDAAKDAQNAWYEGVRNPHVNMPVDTTLMVRPQVGSIPATNLFETPGIEKYTANRASVYDMTPRTEKVTSPLLDEFGKPYQSTRVVTPQKPSLGTLDDIRMDTNAKLRSKYFEAPDQNAALSNPETARLKAVNDGSRDLVYSSLSDSSGVPESDIRSNQQMYGKLSDVADIANKRNTVFSRADPVSLAEKVATGHPGGVTSRLIDFAGQRVLRSVTDSDALVRSAMDRYMNPDGTPLPARDGWVPQAVSAAGRAAQALPPTPKSLFFAPPSTGRSTK